MSVLEGKTAALLQLPVRVNDDGELIIELGANDAQIGAVEIKSAGNNNRAVVDGDGQLFVDVRQLPGTIGQSGAIPKQTISVVVLNGNSSGETDIVVEGYINQILLNTPSINGSGATAEIKILNENNKERYASGELAESSDHVINREMRLSGTTTISIETSVAVGADKTFAIEIY